MESFRALGEFEFDLLAFGQGFKPLTLDSRIMNEDVLPIFLLDEPVTLRVAEPLNPADLSHAPKPSSIDPMRLGGNLGQIINLVA